MTHARKKNIFLLKNHINYIEPSLVCTDGQTMDKTPPVCSKAGTGRGATEKLKLKRDLLHRIQKRYPLRKRLTSAQDDKSCSVRLRRLENVTRSDATDTQYYSSRSPHAWRDKLSYVHCSGNLRAKGGCMTMGNNEKARAGISNMYCRKWSSEEMITLEPRKRRLASLNAEAVNCVLFERKESSLSMKRQRKDCAKINGDCDTRNFLIKGNKSSCSKAASSLGCISKPGSNDICLAGDSDPLVGDEISVGACSSTDAQTEKKQDNDLIYQPVPKRLASLNAVALLKLSNERNYRVKRRLKSDGDGKAEEPSTATKTRVKWGRNKNCVQVNRETPTVNSDDYFEPHGDPEKPFRHTDSLDPATLLVRTGSVKDESPTRCQDSPEEYLHRLSLLMEGSSLTKPEYKDPGKLSPTLKREMLQPTFPFLQCTATPMLGSIADCSCQLASTDFISANGLYFRYNHSGLPVNGFSQMQYSFCPGVGFSHPDSHGGLLVTCNPPTPDSPFSHLHCCNSRHCFGDLGGISGYGSYRIFHPPIGRVGTVHMGRNSCPHDVTVNTDGYKSLEQLSLAIPMAGRPVSPAHPLSGCPVPSVPTAAEPVPPLQTPNLDPVQPQTMSMLKVARECPLSSKPPSGSKSSMRSATGNVNTADKKSSRDPKQQRISRRRATNGWLPVGVSFEKAVYVVDEQEPSIRKCYQAVERDGELIRVRDTVLLKSGPRKKSLPYVAKISALWEDRKTGELMMSLFWYYRPEHIQGGRRPRMHQNEIFASRHQDENSVACIEEKCYVLTFAEYCRFCALVKCHAEGIPSRALALVPPSEEYSTPLHRRVPEDTDPELVFLCRHVYDFRHGRILKNPQ
ncbi:bromo adjacent homology domain-containing 1 protein [Protopterus annectens]|uniref:bromo adjacent homology domain-containing 1 protein n=1 Tax=Protopterus annectens TaxID=7888 RepID=UPI001CF9A7CD|nr:bromo adjacent homology domain-containing 1 protein [Protopterus annectens]XP_043930114.1 bromo adjacent homology domain-containing 1 protein [Protopterus annectens]